MSPVCLNHSFCYNRSNFTSLYSSKLSRTFGIILYFAKESLLKNLFAISEGLAPHSTKKLTFSNVVSSHLPKEKLMYHHKFQHIKAVAEFL